MNGFKRRFLLQLIVRGNIFIRYTVMRCSFSLPFFFVFALQEKKEEEGAEGALCTHNYVCVFFLFFIRTCEKEGDGLCIAAVEYCMGILFNGSLFSFVNVRQN